MNTGHSLEAERQAILDRMQMRRESYRRMLTGGPDIDQIDHVAEMPAGVQPDAHSQREPHSLAAVPAYRPVRTAVPDRFPRSMIMRTITEHPYLCALGVAAVVLIGPKRIARTVVGAGSTAGAIAAGNQSQADMIGKLLALAGAYVQGRSSDNR
ncbi:MAG TPA: hypothetical protein VGE12_18050 [Noviherbaspirillum sp.]